nr:HlyC/CorC family transporter [Aerococcus tenax]
MDDSFLVSIIIFFVCVILSAYFSSSETAFTSASSIRLQNEAELGDDRAKQALDLQNQFDSLLSTILIGNNFVNIAASSIATVIFMELIPEYGATIATVFTTVTLLLFSEITPKLIAKIVPEPFAKFSTPYLRAIMWLFKPLVWLVNQWQKMVQHFFPLEAQEGISEEELLSMVDEARVGGSIEHDEQRLVKAAIRFDDREVSAIITPRIDVEAIDVSDSDQEIEAIFENQPYSRLLVYEEDIDNVLGVLHERDFNRYLREKFKHPEKKILLNSLLLDTFSIPQNMKLATLLRQMQAKQIHMAVVRDEHGGMIGIVTMEDVLEELVGEIWDEDDVVTQDIETIEAGQHYVFSGGCAIEKNQPLLQLPLKEANLYHTINGFATHYLGKLPELGDHFAVGAWVFEVVEEDKQRVGKLDAKRLPEDEVVGQAAQYEESDHDKEE